MNKSFKKIDLQLVLDNPLVGLVRFLENQRNCSLMSNIPQWYHEDDRKIMYLKLGFNIFSIFQIENVSKYSTQNGEHPLEMTSVPNSATNN